MNEVQKAIGSNDLRLSEHTRRRLNRGVSANTRASNTAEWTRFQRWCAGHDRTPMPCTQETLAEFVSNLAEAGLAPATIRRAMSAVRTAHRVAGAPLPETAASLSVLRGYQREEHSRTRLAPVMTVPDLRTILTACPDGLAGIRDRAIITLGWAMMARRSELAALDIPDIHEAPRGLEVLVKSSKTDQDGAGAIVRVLRGQSADTCPVRLLRAWTDAVGESSGPLFRPIDRYGHMGGSPRFAGRRNDPRMTPQAIATLLERAYLRSGVGTRYTPHSLRAGGATAAYEAGADTLDIARHGRWADGSRVLLGYLRPVDAWDRNPMKGTGL